MRGTNSSLMHERFQTALWVLGCDDRTFLLLKQRGNQPMGLGRQAGVHTRRALTPWGHHQKGTPVTGSKDGGSILLGIYYLENAAWSSLK